jgi:hypothetical protein
MSEEIYGRTKTNAGKVLAEIFETSPKFAKQYITSVANITGPEPSGAIDKTLNAVDRLKNEDILVYLADSIKWNNQLIPGVYKEGFMGTPDTAFVATEAVDSNRDWKGEIPATGLHEALLHGAGARHVKSGSTWWGGKLGADIVNYFYPGSYTTREEERRAGQESYLNEEKSLIKSLKDENLYDLYIESLGLMGD